MVFGFDSMHVLNENLIIKLYYDDLEIVNNLNNYFVNVGCDIVSGLTNEILLHPINYDFNEV